MEKPKKNISESVYNRLKNLAREKKRPVQEVFKYYSMERFLYRLSISPWKDAFFLKGGLMLMIWNPISHRATVDIDLLAKTSNTVENLQNIIRMVCAIEVEPPDGIRFVTDSLTLARSQVGADYQGISASFSAQLFTANLPMRIAKWKTFLKDISHEEVSLKTVVCELKDFFEDILTSDRKKA